MLFLREIDTNMIPTQGTNLSAAINTALSAFIDQKDKYKVMIFQFFKRRNGAAEKTRTSTGFIPQRPQRCASTSSATAAIKILFCDNKMI